MSEYNPYRDYRMGEWWDDQAYRFDDDFKGKDEHTAYYNSLPSMIREMDPSMKDVKRTDRGLLDMVMNYMGGYDMMARSPDTPQKVQALAKAYQYGDYGSRPNDSIGDFWENIAGTQAYDAKVGRLSDKELYDQAVQFAKDRLAKGEGQQYENYGGENTGLLDRTIPWIYGKTLGGRY